MPKISVELSEQIHQLAKIKALSSTPRLSLMGYVRELIERDLKAYAHARAERLLRKAAARDGKRT
jgi:hypothetical protein